MSRGFSKREKVFLNTHLVSKWMGGSDAVIHAAFMYKKEIMALLDYELSDVPKLLAYMASKEGATDLEIFLHDVRPSAGGSALAESMRIFLAKRLEVGI